MSRIIPRSEWGAIYGAGWKTRPLPATEVYAHYPGAAAPPGADATLAEDVAYVRYLERIGYERFKQYGEAGAGISYSLIIARSGRIFRGHNPDREASHTKYHNDTGMGYCFLTDATSGLTNQQVTAAAWALNEQVRLGELKTARITGGHRDVYNTICPTDAVMARIPDINAAAGGEGAVSRTQNGWPVIGLNSTKTFTAPNGKVVYCATDYVAQVLGYIAWRWHFEVERLTSATYNTAPNERKGTIVIHAHRPTGATAFQRSQHFSATGMDIMGHKHPYKSAPGSDGFTASQRTKVRSICASVLADSGKSLVRWGGDFPDPNLYDPMHVELRPHPDYSKHPTQYVREWEVTQAVARIWREGYIIPRTRAEIAGWQKIIGVTADSHWGTRSIAACKALQARWGLVQTGRWDKATEDAYNRRLTLVRIHRTTLAKAGVDATVAAVENFQESEGLVVDGLIGQNTLAALQRVIQAAEDADRPVDEDPDEEEIPVALTHVVRIGGKNRYETARNIATHPEEDVDVVVTTGLNFPDAQVVASSYPGTPMLYVKKETVPEDTLAALRKLKPKKVLVVGSEAVVSYEQAKAIDDLVRSL
jgi:hypothetical protein